MTTVDTGHTWDLRPTADHWDGSHGDVLHSHQPCAFDSQCLGLFPSLIRAAPSLLRGLRENMATNNGELNCDRDLRERLKFTFLLSH